MSSRLKVLLVLGHPRRDSLCGGLADAFAAGARQAGVDLRRLDLCELQFNPNVVAGSPRNQPLEPAIREAVELVRWADHMVFVFPTWWGTMPALMKGFLDRVLMPGFAFEEHYEGSGWDKLLTGRSAHLVTTMDTPRWVYRWIYKAPGLNSLARATLGFCGIEPVRTTIFGVVKDSDSATRARWLQEARAHGLRLRDGVLTGAERRRRALGAWVAAMRLQFHPMAWGAYAIGAAGAVQATGRFDAAAFWLGLLSLFLLEVIAVFTNDYFDFESDRRNKNFGPFTGGSRVLVEGRISPARMVNRGGYKVYSVEVENVLSHHPAVLESAIVGRPCPVLGERVHAFVTLKRPVSQDELKRFCGERLADYKVPETFTLLDEALPRNANGKLLKRALREAASG